MRYPPAKTVRRVIEHLEELGLFVAGPYTDLNTGERLGANMDYDINDILKYRQLVRKDQLWEAEQ